MDKLWIHTTKGRITLLLSLGAIVVIYVVALFKMTG